MRSTAALCSRGFCGCVCACVGRHYAEYFRSQINWQQVAAGIKTRTASQCMTKWYATRLQMATVGGMWSQGEDARLIHAVAAQNPTSLRGTLSPGVQPECVWDCVASPLPFAPSTRRCVA